MPELPLSLDLHLHHRVVGILDALQGLLNAWEQVNDLLLANQDLTVEEKGRELGEALLWKRHRVPTVPPVATRTRGGCKGPWGPCLGSGLSGLWPSPSQSCRCSHLAQALTAHRQWKSLVTHSLVLHKSIPRTFRQIAHFCTSSSAACRDQSPSLLCNGTQKYTWAQEWDSWGLTTTTTSAGSLTRPPLHSQLLHLVSLATGVRAPLKLNDFWVQSHDLIIQVTHFCHLEDETGKVRSAIMTTQTQTTCTYSQHWAFQHWAFQASRWR